MSRCWFSDIPGAGPCDGKLVRVHLIPRALLKREFPRGFDGKSHRTLSLDPRCWVWGCGGIMGNAGHNGQLDITRTLRVPRHRLPEGTEEFARELGLEWWLEREYGPTVGDAIDVLSRAALTPMPGVDDAA